MCRISNLLFVGHSHIFVKIVCLVMSFFCWGCNEKTNKEPSAGIEVINSNALNQVLFAEQREATSVVFMTTGGAWTSTLTEESVSWIEFDPEKGDTPGRYTVYMGLKTNTTGNDRTAVFTIHCGNQKCDITITQKAVDSNGNPYKELEQFKINVGNSAALNQELYADQTKATSVIFITDAAWTSTLTGGDDSWITFDPAQGNAPGQYTVSITLTRNTTGSDRTAVFTIRCDGEECEITITQKSVGSDGKPYKPDEMETIEEYFNRDWDILQNARTQALAEDRTPLSTPAIQKILFVACTNTSLAGTTYLMDEMQKQFFRDVAKNYEEVVEYYSNYNVDIQTDILFIDRNVVVPDENPAWVKQDLIQQELNIHAPVGAYDGILVSAARNLPNVHMGVKTAGYENLYGYSWLKLYIPTGGSTPPTSTTYTVPKANEAPFLSTDVAIHEWLHQLEFFSGLLDYTFPATHAYMGPPDFPEYVKYPSDPVWDFTAYYRDYVSGNVLYSSGGVTRKIGMFPLMWRISPRFLNSEAVYIINEANGLYLTYSGNITSFSTTPCPWYLRYNGKINDDDRYLILTSDNRTLDIRNASNSQGNSVGIFGVNGSYPQAQNFRFSQNSDGTYKMTTTFASNNRVLQRNTGTTYETGTTINTDNGSVDQKWRLINKPR